MFLKLRCVLLLLCGLLALSLPFQPAMATRLPSGLQDYLRQKDADVKVRFDGMIVFSNGESYLPVFPQTLEPNDNPTQLLKSWPEKVAYPDILQFDNNLFLLRLVPTSSGKLTLPRGLDYPLALKEGLLPEDLILPANLSIPAELRVILGRLPYETPTETPANPVGANQQPLVPLQPSTASNPLAPANTNGLDKTLYLSDLNQAKLIAVNPLNGKPRWDVSLDCLPQALALNEDGSKIYATCLGRDEVVVVDTLANLVTSRIRVGERPSGLFAFPKAGLLVSLSNYSKNLTLISMTQNLREAELPLPASGGAVTGRKRLPVAYVSQAGGSQIYEMDLKGQRLLRTLNKKGKLPYLKDISAMLVQESSNGLGYLWVLSRSQQKLQVIDLLTEAIVFEGTVGEKPVGFYEGRNNQIYVLCAESDTIEVFSSAPPAQLEPIYLPVGSFASAMALESDRHTAYVASAATEKLLWVDLDKRTVKTTFGSPYRALSLKLWDAAADEITEALAQEASSASVIALPVSEPPAKPVPEVSKTPLELSSEAATPQTTQKIPSLVDELTLPAPQVPLDALVQPQGVRKPQKGWWPFALRGPR
jgi:YVTN family beta-propeller protein